MISPAIQQLYDEHETILRAIDQLRRILESPDLASRNEELRSLLLFFRDYADGYHHLKEEEVLFPALAEANSAMEAITESLSEHHTLFREALASTESAMDSNDWESARTTLEKYASDLVDHISAENDELFVVSDDLLSTSEMDRMYYKFLDCDRELGAVRKNHFEEVVGRG